MPRRNPPAGVTFALGFLALLAGAVATPVAAQTRYVAFGDSITEGNVGDDPNRSELGYPPRLEALLAGAGVDATVANRGEGGEKTFQGVTRIDEVLAEGGDVLLLMEGTNDISQDLSLETTLFNLSEMARKAEDAGLSVIHATCIPRYPEAKKDAANLRQQRMNESIRDLAGGSGRGLADPFEVFGREPDLFDRFYAPASSDDPVGHPNAPGYDLLADLFFDVLSERDEVPPVTGVQVPSNGEHEVAPGQAIDLDIWDFGRGIDLVATTLLIDGSPVSAIVQGNSRGANIGYSPPQPWRGVVRVGLRSRDNATPANAVDRDVAQFVVAGTIFLAGDLDEDGRVDGTDLAALARAFGARRQDSRYLAAADLNDDDLVDGVDLAQLATNFGRTSF